MNANVFFDNTGHRGAALALACAIATSHVWAQAPSTPTSAPATKPNLTVTAQALQHLSVLDKVQAHGNMAAWQEAWVSAPMQGLRVTELLADVGDTVKAGQTLAVLDTQTMQAELAQLKAAQAESQVLALEAQANAQRTTSLQQTGAMSEQQIAQYTTAAAAAQARVDAIKAQVHLQEVRLKQAHIVAPDDGIVMTRPVQLGAVLGAGQELFKIMRQGRLEWRAEVPSIDLPKIKVGQSVAIKTNQGGTVKGKVRMLAPGLDAATRTGLVYVDVQSAWGSGLKPGMLVAGQLQIGQSDALTMPYASLVMRDGFAYIFTLTDAKPDGIAKVTRHKIATGRRVDDRLELLGNWPANTKVVVQGAGFLSDGDTVRVVTGAAVAAQRTP